MADWRDLNGRGGPLPQDVGAPDGAGIVDPDEKAPQRKCDSYGDNSIIDERAQITKPGSSKT
jgi:hypothetical protein